MAMDLMGRGRYPTRLTEAQADRAVTPVRPLHHILGDRRDAERRLSDAPVVWGIVEESRRFQEGYQRNLETGHSEPERDPGD